MATINPYQILGVSENDSIEHIDYVYREFIKLLHPDKLSSQNLKIKDQEKAEYLQLIRDAYNAIMSSNVKLNNPKRSNEYKNDIKITMDKAFINNGKISQANSESFDKKFNEAFEHRLEIDRNAGLTNGFERGYKEFDNGKNFESSGPLTLPSYSGDIDVKPSAILQHQEIGDTRLTEYKPEFVSFADTAVNYQEVGITSVSDFTMAPTGKSGIGGADLMSVYGANYEPWEKTAMRDSRLSTKFTDSTNITQKMSKMESTRGTDYDFIPTEPLYLESVKTAEQVREQLAMLKKNDATGTRDYYNKFAREELGE